MNFLRLIRWQNLLFIGLILWTMEKCVAVPILDAVRFGEQLPGWIFWMLIVSVVLIAGGGYAINDYFDVKIDRINRPDRLLVTNVYSKEQTMRIFQVLTLVGLVLGGVVCWVIRSWTLFLLLIITTGLLWFYSSSYKRQFIIGNLIVAFVSGLTPLVIALANVGILEYRYAGIIQYTTLPRDLYMWIGGFGLFAFLMTWIREIIKDLQDQMGDRELECHSLPIVFGETWTKVIVTCLILLTMGLLSVAVFVWMPFPHEWGSASVRFWLFGLLIPLAGEVALLWSAKIPSDYQHAQWLMKFIMFIGLMFAFVIQNQL